MIRAAAALVVAVALGVASALWLPRWLEPQPAGRELPPQLRTVEIDPLPEAPPAPDLEPPAADPEPELVEEVIAAPAPFAEAPLADAASEPEPVAAPPPATGPRDQDAWADLIRRMLALQRRARGG